MGDGLAMPHRNAHLTTDHANERGHMELDICVDTLVLSDAVLGPKMATETSIYIYTHLCLYVSMCVYLYIYIFIYIYIYIYIFFFFQATPAEKEVLDKE